MLDVSYNLKKMIGLMEILKDADGPNRVPEFQSSHREPENRIKKSETLL
jgi:predicted Zn-dependent protease